MIRSLLAGLVLLVGVAAPVPAPCWDCWRTCYIAGAQCGGQNCLCACHRIGDCACFTIYTPYDRLELEGAGWRLAP